MEKKFNEAPRYEEAPAYLGMYDISGYDKVSSHSLKRYRRDKGQDALIKKFAEDSKLPKNETTHSVSQTSHDLGAKRENIHDKIAGFVLENEKLALKRIQQGLNDPEIEVQKAFAKMIWAAPTEERVALVKRCLDNPNIEIQEISAGMLKFIPKEERNAIEMLVLEKVKQGLNNPDIRIQKISAEMIHSTPEGERQKLLESVSQKGLDEEIIRSRLYSGKDINNETFSRQKFEKSGSETLLLGGELKDKTIIRKINSEAFLSWQRLYEDYDLWKNAGFDYVPIEPIQSYKLNKDGFVSVYCGILDLNLSEWTRKVDIFTEELERQRDKIIKVLKRQKIKHGHMHNDNFCLRFFRNEKGQPDFKRVPRIYLIDFDQAISTAK